MYKGKNILITGGSSGLGKYMALAYANKQGRIINLSRNIDKMKNLDSKLNILNGLDNKYFSVDVSKYNDIVDVNREWPLSTEALGNYVKDKYGKAIKRSSNSCFN